jgi:hypothetical protein
VKGGLSRQEARTPAYANWSGFVAAGYFRDLPKGFSIYVEPSFSLARYDEALLAFGRKRSDNSQSVLVTLLNRHLVLTRFTPLRHGLANVCKGSETDIRSKAGTSPPLRRPPGHKF